MKKLLFKFLDWQINIPDTPAEEVLIGGMLVGLLFAGTLGLPWLFWMDEQFRPVTIIGKLVYIFIVIVYYLFLIKFIYSIFKK